MNWKELIIKGSERSLEAAVRMPSGLLLGDGFMSNQKEKQGDPGHAGTAWGGGGGGGGWGKWGLPHWQINVAFEWKHSAYAHKMLQELKEVVGKCMRSSIILHS